jgi:hypothetical protein
MLKVDFSSLQKRFDPLPDGIYDVEIIKVELKTNKHSKGTHLNWHLKIIDEDILAECSSAVSTRLFLITPLKENALWKLKKFLKILDHSFYGAIAEIDPERLIGKQLKVKVIQERYNNSLYNKVIDFMRI